MPRPLPFARLARRALPAVLLAAVAAPHGRAADPQPYEVQLAPTGQEPLDRALRDSSNLIGLREAPVGPFALIARAREDVGRLQAALESQGYYAGQIRIAVLGRPLDDPALPDLLDRAPADPVPVAVQVGTGPRFHLRRVEARGGLPDGLALGLDPGAPAVAADVVAARDRLLTALRARGFALAKVGEPVATLDPAARALDVAVPVETGPRVDLGPIALRGLDRVEEDFVRRRLLVHRGERFDPARIEEARQDLVSLGVFSSVGVRASDRLDAAGQLPLTFEVAERPRRAASVTAAWSTDLGGSVGATFQHRNLFGRAEQLNLSAAATQLGGSATRSPGYDVNAGLIKPDFLARDQSLQFTLRAVKEDLDAYDRTAFIGGVALSRKFSRTWTASLGLTATQSRVAQEGQSYNYQLLALPVGLRHDSTGVEGLLDPTRGIRAAASVSPTQSFGGSPEGGDATFVLLQLAGSTYLDVGSYLGGREGRGVLALRGLVGSAQGASTFELPPDQRFYAGGGGTVRGYKYQSIGPRFPSGRPTGGTSVTAATVEYRQRIGGSFGAAVFVDAGQVNTSSAPFTGDVRLGAGVGARYYTAIGPIRLDVAVPLDKRRRDDDFQLYIGLGQAF